MKIKAEVANAVRNFFVKRGFTEIFTPYILATSTEGGAEMFKLDYFGTPAVLAQSCQFYKQAAVQVHEKVFSPGFASDALAEFMCKKANGIRYRPQQFRYFRQTAG